MSARRGAPTRLVLRGVTVAGSGPVDLSVESGEVVGVSGWASSELFWVIAGLHRPSAGQVQVDGLRIRNHEQALAGGVHLVPPGNALASLLTAYENVLLPLDGAADPDTRTREALAAVGLAESADHLVEELSGGQQQRVAIARALASRPRLLLADQATTDLDPANRELVVRLMRELARSGAAVLLASDDPAVNAECDRTVSLER